MQMLNPNSHDSGLALAIRDFLDHPPAQPFEPKNSQDEFSRAFQIAQRVRDIVTSQVLLLEAKLRDEENKRMSLETRLINLEADFSMVRANYNTLVQENARFMRSCVCVTLHTPPNPPMELRK